MKESSKAISRKVIALLSCITVICLTFTAFLPVSAFAEQKPEGKTVALSEFPDNNLRRLMADKYDKNKDQVLSQAEIENILFLDVTDRSYPVKDITGVEYFTHLKTLDCSGLGLTELNTSTMPGLKTLACHNNKLTHLDFSRNPLLQIVDCMDNNISYINLEGFNTDRMKAAGGEFVTDIQSSITFIVTNGIFDPSVIHSYTEEDMFSLPEGDFVLNSSSNNQYVNITSFDGSPAGKCRFHCHEKSHYDKSESGHQLICPECPMNIAGKFEEHHFTFDSENQDFKNYFCDECGYLKKVPQEKDPAKEPPVVDFIYELDDNCAARCNKTAVDEITAMLKGHVNHVYIKVSSADKSTVKDAIGIYSLNISANEDGVTRNIESLKNGKVMISVPFNMDDNMKIHVFKRDKDMKLSPVDFQYDHGRLTWAADSSSDYVIANEKTADKAVAPLTSDDNPVMFLVLIIGACLAAVYKLQRDVNK